MPLHLVLLLDPFSVLWHGRGPVAILRRQGCTHSWRVVLGEWTMLMCMNVFGLCCLSGCSGSSAVPMRLLVFKKGLVDTSFWLLGWDHVEAFRAVAGAPAPAKVVPVVTIIFSRWCHQQCPSQAWDLAGCPTIVESATRSGASFDVVPGIGCWNTWHAELDVISLLKAIPNLAFNGDISLWQSKLYRHDANNYLVPKLLRLSCYLRQAFAFSFIVSAMWRGWGILSVTQHKPPLLRLLWDLLWVSMSRFSWFPLAWRLLPKQVEQTCWKYLRSVHFSHHLLLSLHFCLVPR